MQQLPIKNHLEVILKSSKFIFAFMRVQNYFNEIIMKYRLKLVMYLIFYILK